MTIDVHVYEIKFEFCKVNFKIT